MKLLVSVVNETEASESIKGGAHIIDVKNPKEGSLGANFPRVIRQVKGAVRRNVEVSATIGDMPNLPGTASLAALGACVSGADYVKVGLFGVKTSEEATTLMNEVCKAVKEYNRDLKTIAAGYADFRTVGCVSPLELPAVAHKVKADGVLVDIKVKNGKSNLFNFLTDQELKEIVEKAHDNNLIVALAGSLDKQHIRRVYDLAADIIGVRGAVCTNRDRVAGRVQKEKVMEFTKEISLL
ncbi:MAG: (5-formylfuran-3-yl)methyl phosphate synthase [Candidatus Bathyarchaeum sp.]|nr:MAG: (5-formylfuran-3-yl)methyl phosphate synthase [Candidatus Bathyarchaeum sp.]